MKSLSNPLLIISDNPGLRTGLARVARDLASLAATMPEWRVATLGRGEGSRQAFPWMQYSFHESGQWGENWLEEVWRDFAAGEEGVIFTLDDPSRRLWFARPETLGDTRLGRFLGPGRNFRKWGYFPVDGTGPSGHALGQEARAVVEGYDRVLAASEWGRDTLRRGGRVDADWLPHGIGEEWKRVPGARELVGWAKTDVVVGAVMANQARKDFPVLFETAALMKGKYGNRFRLWLHTDLMIRYWNVWALGRDYGVDDCLEVTLELEDHALAARYSACDGTLLPSGGEGFGFPVAESLACGTASIVPDYAAAQELVEEGHRVMPVTYRVDTMHNVRRAVLSGHGFAAALAQEIESDRDREIRAEELQERVEHLRWRNLRHSWEKWLREGLRG